MKLITSFLLISILFSCYGQNRSKQNKVNIQEDTIMINKDSIKIEYYDFNTTENGTISVAYERADRWLVQLSSMKNAKTGSSTEYAPASDFYELQKSFYLNGIIKERGKYIQGVAFGKHEYFDEQGNCIKIVDEDKKFGSFKREDVIKFLEKEGWFNRETGENIVTRDSILPTNYKFYREIERYMTITFKRAVLNKQGKEIEPPKWFIEIDPQFKMNITRYIINGNTGEFEKKETFEPKII